MIPPLLVNNKFISEFCVKANLFNDFFASMCAPINNGSTLPQFSYMTDVNINSFLVNQNDISLITKTLNAEKAHGWDNILINNDTFFFNSTLSQSGFLLRDSCIAQLLLISKAFDKVCHKGLLFKLKSYDVEGELLSLLECYLSNREQRVAFNGQTSN